MSRILIVDDEKEIRDVIREYATFNDYEVLEASNGFEAVVAVKENSIDLIIMDIMMPGLDGFGAVKQIKKIADIPTIMLSARGEEYDKLFGFELGVDDYVTKPFSPRELMARISAILKRKGGKVRENKKEVFGGLVIDVDGRSVTVDGKKADLTPKEYDLLFYLVKNKGVAMSRESILSDVWGYTFFGEDRTVDTHIKMLRSNLGVYRDHIVTLRGMGYKFVEKIEE
ncbi:MAG: response regulator transcription factor [Clostridia bacterium]|nr:response regulator transcription factor [Clostridia bacterium]